MIKECTVSDRIRNLTSLDWHVIFCEIKRKLRIKRWQEKGRRRILNLGFKDEPIMCGHVTTCMWLPIPASQEAAITRLGCFGYFGRQRNQNANEGMAWRDRLFARKQFISTRRVWMVWSLRIHRLQKFSLPLFFHSFFFFFFFFLILRSLCGFLLET